MAIPTQAEARAILKRLDLDYYLLDNRSRIRHPRAKGGQFNDTRRVAPWGTRGPIPQGVLHSYEADIKFSIIAAAEYLVTRTTPGSYHGLAGDDSPTDVLPCAPVTAETWHCVPSNPWAIGWSAVMKAHTWRSIPTRSRDNIVRSLAYGFYLSSLELIALGKSPIPAKRITRAEAMRGVWGFTMHRHMDPGRRSDIANPESDFPWDAFFAEYTRLLGGDTTTTASPTIPEGHLDMGSMSPDELNRHLSRHAENTHRGVQNDLKRLILPQLDNVTTALARVAGGETLDEAKLKAGVRQSAAEGAREGVLSAQEELRDVLQEFVTDDVADQVVSKIATRLTAQEA